MTTSILKRIKDEYERASSNFEEEKLEEIMWSLSKEELDKFDDIIKRCYAASSQRMCRLTIENNTSNKVLNVLSNVGFFVNKDSEYNITTLSW